MYLLRPFCCQIVKFFICVKFVSIFWYDLYHLMHVNNVCNRLNECIMTKRPHVFVSKPLEDISCVSWNRQVQHILASASPSGRASVWDLRKNDLIIKVSDHSNRVRCSFCTQMKSWTILQCCPLNLNCLLFVCMSLFLDALLRAGVEPRSGHSAGLVLGGRPDAGHTDVGLTICYLSFQDFREPHTVNTPFTFSAKAA